jgi:hypothetical protein
MEFDKVVREAITLSGSWRTSAHCWCQMRQLHPGSVVIPFPTQLPADQPQKGMQRINAWLQSLLSTAATASSDFTYALLNVRCTLLAICMHLLEER